MAPSLIPISCESTKAEGEHRAAIYMNRLMQTEPKNVCAIEGNNDEEEEEEEEEEELVEDPVQTLRRPNQQNVYFLDFS